MKPFRKNLAIAIDGGGRRGVIVTKALSMLEEAIERSLHELSRLYAGTSTGSIIGTMMVHLGHADGMVSAAVHTTAHTIRPALSS